MKRIIPFILLFVFVLVLIVSTSSRLMKIFSDYRFNANSLLRSDRINQGDLYGISYLSKFRNLDIDAANISLDRYCVKRKINLYVIGDSYLKNFVKSDTIFCGVKKYFFLNPHDSSTTIKIAEKEDNILLIETVERHLSTYFADPNFITNSFVIENKENKRNFKKGNIFFKEKIRGVSHAIAVSIYNPNINQNLELNLFDYRFFTFFKEVKASLNYNLFHRTNIDVVLSPDKEYLLFNETVNTTSLNSSFVFISDERIDSIVESLNHIYSYYKGKGFKEVYFAIMPNPVSVLYQTMGQYNYLIPRVQNHKNLKVPIVNIYDVFKKEKRQVYQKSDTHWNLNGFNLWVNEFNKKLYVIESN